MRKFKIVKCPHCTRTFKKADSWCNHMITKHPDDIPEGFTPMRYLYGTITGKYKGECMYCSNETEWNEATGKYGRICGSPKCRDRYAADHQLLSPSKQREMLQKRKISSIYKYDGIDMYYTGKYELRFLEFMQNVMDWPASDIMSPSPNTYYYEYNNPDDKYHEGVKFYIPDFFIPSLNLEIEIKDQTTTHPKFLKIDKVKEACKDKRMEQLQYKVNYFKINDNNFMPFINYLKTMKLSFDDTELFYSKLKKASEVVKGTESVEYNEQADALARELCNHERVIRWMNDTHLTLIDYCDSIEELNELFDEWNSMSDPDKAISDRQSIELFGIDNTTHYQQLKSLLTDVDVFLPHVYDAQNVGEAASEGYVKDYTMGVIESMNNIQIDTTDETNAYGIKKISDMLDKIASSSLIYTIVIQGLDRGTKEVKFAVEHEVPIFKIPTTTIPLYFEPKLGKYNGLYAGKSFRSILCAVLERMVDALKTDGVINKDIELVVGCGLYGREPESFKEYAYSDEKIYKINDIEDLMAVVDIISEEEPDNEQVDELDGIIHPRANYGTELSEKISGVHELCLRTVQSHECTIPSILLYMLHKASKLFHNSIINQRHEESINRCLNMIKKYSDAPVFDTELVCRHILDIRSNFGDFAEYLEYVKKVKEISKDFLENHVYCNISDPVELAELSDLVKFVASMKTNAFHAASAEIFSTYLEEMYNRLAFENRERFVNLVKNLGEGKKVLFTADNPSTLRFIADSFAADEVATLDKRKVGANIYVVPNNMVSPKADLPKFDMIVSFGLEELAFSDIPEDVFDFCRTDDTIVYVVTLDTGSVPNISNGIEVVMNNIKDLNIDLSEIDIPLIMGYESYCTSPEFSDIAYEGLVTSKAVPMNIDKLHLKAGWNILYVVSDSQEFCRNLPFLAKYENVEYLNIDAILFGEENAAVFSELNTVNRNYHAMAKRYKVAVKKNLASNSYKDDSPFFDYFSDVIDGIYLKADNNPSTIYVVYGYSLTSIFRQCIIDNPLVIHDPSLLKTKLHSSIIGEDYNDVSNMLYSGTQKYHRSRKMLRMTKNLSELKIKEAKGNTSDPVFYHVSLNDDLQTLVPRIPTSSMFGENISIPRVCVSSDIGKCIQAIPASRISAGTIIYVYKPKMINGTRYYKPSKREVPDRNLTDEYWILDDVVVKLDHAIIVKSVKDKKEGNGVRRVIMGSKMSDLVAIRRALKLGNEAFNDEKLNLKVEELYEVYYQ